MFDFSHTAIGTMPNEDIYGRAGNIMDITAGINPAMRQEMDRSTARYLAQEDKFNTLLAGGANPLAMALAYPDQFYRRTGKELAWDLNGQQLLRDVNEPMASRQARIDTWLANQRAMDSADAERSAIRTMMIGRDLEAYNSPVATALRQLDPETAKRIALGQSGYTDTYGYGGAPSKSQQAISLARTQNEPAMAGAELKRQEYVEGAPFREFQLEAGRKGLGMKEMDQKLEALGKELTSLQKALDNEFTVDGRNKIFQRMQEVSNDMRKLANIPVQEKQIQRLPPETLDEIGRKYNPRRQANQRMSIRLDDGTAVDVTSDGNRWRETESVPRSNQTSNRGA